MYQFDSFSAEAFRSPPSEIKIENQTMKYLDFCKPENRGKNPVVILGGAFQTFRSFVGDVRSYIDHFPIIIVFLPSHKNLNIADQSRLLEKFLNERDHHKAHVLGYSYGSIIAYQFALQKPEKVENLLLMGCAIKLSESLRAKMEYGVKYAQLENIDLFAEACVQTLFNVPKFDKTGTSKILLKKFTESLRRMSHAELESYRINTNRLIDAEVVPGMLDCRTLVMTSEYDHFVRPHDSLEILDYLTNSTFALVKNSDHLVPLQQPKVLYQTILEFLLDQKISSPMVILNEEAKGKLKDRRRNSRLPTSIPVSVVGNRETLSLGTIEDINEEGCKIRFAGEFRESGIYDIIFSDIEVEAFIKSNGTEANVVFMKGLFHHTEQLNNLIKSLILQAG